MRISSLPCSFDLVPAGILIIPIPQMEKEAQKVCPHIRLTARQLAAADQMPGQSQQETGRRSTQREVALSLNSRGWSLQTENREEEPENKGHEWNQGAMHPLSHPSPGVCGKGRTGSGLGTPLQPQVAGVWKVFC